MTTITLEVPDELAGQLASLGGRLPDLLANVLRAKPTVKNGQANGTGANVPLYREITDFLATSPAPEQLIAFQISHPAQARLEDLLDKNREEDLTVDETAELDAYLQARDLMILLKANAQPDA